tara:strand:- start:219 stop:479 length:261 start_codon:yes stop_codon:yes gene_type:complete
MTTLIQIIIFINNLNSPQISIVNHYNNMDDCSLTLAKIKLRYNENNSKAYIKDDYDDMKYLEVFTDNSAKKSYWYCKKALFYKENS